MLHYTYNFKCPTHDQMVFNHTFDFDCSVSYKPLKIMEIIIYILYMHKNAFTILIWAIIICRSSYAF